MGAPEFFSFRHNREPSISPQYAIIVHSSRGISDTPYVTDQMLASMHSIVTGNDGATELGAGKLVSKEDFEQILKSILEMKSNKVEFLPGNVLSVSENHIAWTVPAMVRPMIFNMAGMKMTKINVPWPQLLMVATKNGSLSVAAFKCRGRPKATTKLYNAPLMNVNNAGVVCTGTATVPDGCSISDLAAWEDVMFKSAFSHINNKQTLKLDGIESVENKHHLRFWKDLAKKKEVRFPNANLVPMGSTVEQFIRRHAK